MFHCCWKRGILNQPILRKKMQIAQRCEGFDSFAETWKFSTEKSKSRFEIEQPFLSQFRLEELWINNAAGRYLFKSIAEWTVNLLHCKSMKYLHVSPNEMSSKSTSFINGGEKETLVHAKIRQRALRSWSKQAWSGWMAGQCF